MIFYGWRKKTLLLAGMPMQSCSRCGAPGALQLFVNYTTVHLYWIFGVLTSRKYIAQCASCRTGAVVNKHDVAHLIQTNPIPFMERWGLATLLGLGALAVVVYTVAH